MSKHLDMSESYGERGFLKIVSYGSRAFAMASLAPPARRRRSAAISRPVEWQGEPGL